MLDDPVRSHAAREAAERALIRVVHHYGSRPEFVVLGGLVPQLLCSRSDIRHAGTTDVDVQVNLEIACSAVNAKQLEHALWNAEFRPDSQRVWRWVTGVPGAHLVVKFELLADLDDTPAEAIIKFDGCKDLGAVNLRGTGFASEDIEVRELRARVGGVEQHAEVNVTGLAGFLMAKCAAAQARRASKDWYDIAFVLLHNDAGGPQSAAQIVRERFGSRVGAQRSALTICSQTSRCRLHKGPLPTLNNSLRITPTLITRRSPLTPCWRSRSSTSTSASWARSDRHAPIRL